MITEDEMEQFLDQIIEPRYDRDPGKNQKGKKNE